MKTILWSRVARGLIGLLWLVWLFNGIGGGLGSSEGDINFIDITWWLLISGVNALIITVVVRSSMKRRLSVLHRQDREIWEAVGERLWMDTIAIEPPKPYHWQLLDVYLQGSLDGIESELRIAPIDSHGRALASATAKLTDPSEAPLRRARLSRADEESASPGTPLRLGDPLLDNVIRVELSERATEVDEARIRHVLSLDALRGPLLAVLHQWPGARIEPDAVVIERHIQRVGGSDPLSPPPEVAEMEQAMRDAASLAAFLSALDAPSQEAPRGDSA